MQNETNCWVNALHGEEKIVYTLSACLTARKIWISIDDSWPNFFFVISLCSRKHFHNAFTFFWYEIFVLMNLQT